MNSLGALHPALVHFPIGILSVVPVLILVAVFSAKRRHGVMLATAFVLMTGTIASFLAVASGEMTLGVARVPQVEGDELGQAIHDHEVWAENSRTIFVILTVVYGLLVFTPPGLKWLKTPKGTVIAQLVFLVVYAWALAVLLRVGYLGGLLVHKWGITVPME